MTEPHPHYIPKTSRKAFIQERKDAQKRKRNKKKKDPRESTIEAYLRKRAIELGIQIEKYVSPNRRGVADRVLYTYPGIAAFIEVKRKDGSARKLQEKYIKDKTELGFFARIVKSKEEVDLVLAQLLAFRKSVSEVRS